MSGAPGRGVVAIVGRPNVGKSTLFNRLAGRRIAIVEQTPGLTRDRIYAACEWRGKRFTLIDTGGLQLLKGGLLEEVRKQTEFALEEADVILFAVDGKEGITGLDQEVAALLRRRGKPLLVVVNKVETRRRAEEAVEFCRLGMGEPIPVSASHGTDIGELLDRLAELLPETAAAEEEGGLRVAIVGKPNVGKSSLLNAVLGQERAIVDAVAGTTRDAIDTPLRWQGRRLVLIDTAGIRRKSKAKESFEYYSVLRAFGAIERAEAAVVVIDGTAGVTEQDKRICGFVHEEGRAQVVAVNKWDLRDPEPSWSKGLMEEFAREASQELAFASYAPVCFVSAKEKVGVERLMEAVWAAGQQHSLHMPAEELNEVVTEAAWERGLSRKGKPVRVYYAAQVATRPPTVALFVNEPKRVHFSQRRYLENRLRERFGLGGTPLRLLLRASDKRRAEAEKRAAVRRDKEEGR
jgi:GTP-binding protein